MPIARAPEKLYKSLPDELKGVTPSHMSRSTYPSYPVSAKTPYGVKDLLVEPGDWVVSFGGGTRVVLTHEERVVTFGEPGELSEHWTRREEEMIAAACQSEPLTAHAHAGH